MYQSVKQSVLLYSPIQKFSAAKKKTNKKTQKKPQAFSIYNECGQKMFHDFSAEFDNYIKKQKKKK